jgi:putative MATE family efflux protein
MDPATRLLLEGPIAPTLLRLAAPNVVMLVAQVAISILEAYYVGWLGADALAGVSVTFPLVMLMQTMSAGGMGGGVASAVARALGAGRRADASRLLTHAIAIALVMAGLFTVIVLGAGRAIYHAMGARDGAMAAALAYSNVIFAGAAAVWLFNTLASAVRGTGNMLLPAGVVLGGSPLLVTLSPALIFGWGPFPRLGVTGAALAVVAYYVAGVLVLFAYLASGRSLVRLSPTLRFERSSFAAILRVGAPSLINNVMTNLTVVILTALVGPFGTFALAGYGMGVRLEYLLIPLVFGFGSALVTMVGTNFGAGQRTRARRVAWTGALMAAGVTEAIGLAAAVFPHAWLGLFSNEPRCRGRLRTCTWSAPPTASSVSASRSIRLRAPDGSVAAPRWQRASGQRRGGWRSCTSCRASPPPRRWHSSSSARLWPGRSDWARGKPEGADRDRSRSRTASPPVAVSRSPLQ